MSSRRPASVPIAMGADDPRLCEIDDEFCRIVVAMSFMMKMSRVQKSRFFHKVATSAQGTLQILDRGARSDTAIAAPELAFFHPGRRFQVLARYSNSSVQDDLCPDARGVSLRLLDGDAASSFDHSLLDLPLNTGQCFSARSAAIIHRYTLGGLAEREALAQQIPEFRSLLWGVYRTATSFAAYHYHSQIPVSLEAADGRQWLARFRLLPADKADDEPSYTPVDRAFPPDPPDTIARPAGDTRSPSYLHDDLRARIRGGGVTALLQVQLHPVTGAETVDDEALDGSRRWSEASCPWHDLGRLHLDALVSDPLVERLAFNPGLAPPGLGVILARSPHQAASLNHLRVLLYRLGAAARRGERLPADLEALLRRGREPVAVTAQTGPTRGATRTVCILGGGASGLTLARELERNGHQAIVLESQAEVGGKCESVVLEGRVYDLGGHLCTNQYQRLARLAAELGVATEDTTPSRIFDLEQRSAGPQSAAFFRRDTFQRYSTLRRSTFPAIAEPGLAHSARALAQPVTQWLREHDLEPLQDSVGIGYTAAGYGYLDGEIPALQLVKYAEMTGLLATQPALPGHAGSFTIAGGFQGLWRRVAAGLRDVRCGVRITAIERYAGGVRVHTDGGTIEAEDLIITLPINQALPILDATPDERDLAARVRHVHYYTTVAEASGLPRTAFYLIRQHAQAGAPRGRCVSFHHRYLDRQVYTFYSYGADGLDERDLRARLREDVASMGGHLNTVHLQRKWSFMPHFGSQDSSSGAYDRLEEMQGKRHTWWAGSLPAYELIECNIAYAEALVQRFFAAPRSATAPPSAERGAGQRVSAPSEITPRALRDWLVTHSAAELGIPETSIDPRAPLERYAFSSLSVAALLAELSDWLGWRVPHTLFLDWPSIEAAANSLAGLEQRGALPQGRGGRSTTAARRAPRSPLLLLLQPVRPLFCVGGAPGSTFYMRPLARALGTSQPFYGLQAPGHDGSEEPIDRIEELAGRYLSEIREVQPHGPYLLGGHSFGGLVAYEMGRQLRAENEAVERIILLDAFVPLPGQPVPPPDDAAAIEELIAMNRFMYPADVSTELGRIEPGMTLAEQCQQLGLSLGATGRVPVEEHVANILRVYQASVEAVVHYQPPRSDLALALLKATSGFPPVMKGERQVLLRLDDPENGWEHLSPLALRTIHVPGDHFSMFTPPHVDAVAAALRACLHPTPRL